MLTEETDMSSLSKLAILLIGLVVCDSGLAQESPDSTYRWAQWRGPLGTGEAAETADPPIRWSETENVKWKTPIRGLGHSTPVVWDDHIFLTSAQPFGEAFEPIADGRPGSHHNLKVSQKHRYLVTAIDRKSGKVLWEKTVHENVPHEGSHESSSLAAASLVTDGEYVLCFFWFARFVLPGL